MIRFRDASRWYGEVIGLNDVNVEIGPGVTALLGQNGAGKTTMMRLITGQLRPTTGRVEVFGENPFANAAIYSRIGYCPAIDSFPEHLTGRQFVHRMARYMGFHQAEAASRTQKMLERVGMADRCDKRLRGFSKGMRQRIKLAQAMIHDPEMLLLDEPLSGLDPVGRREIMDFLQEFADQGKIVLVSSHILFEVEEMTRSILLLHRGRLLAAGDLRSIRELIDRHPHRVRILTDQAREVASRLMALPYVISVEVDASEKEVEIRTREVDRFYDALPGLVLDENLRMFGFESPDNNLEAVFQYLVEA
ncbi:MAG: ABC transporter ATP-binding protein [Armatimonadetes bacterium]|nr:ABC transporter ATP-binding protein [Armatimonadota bacterium]